MQKKTNVGVVGLGWGARHIACLVNNQNAEVVAVCARNAVKAREVANTYGIGTVYTDYREMLAKAGLDAVVVATPDDLHYQMVNEALDSRLHVLCEKPLALDAGQAAELCKKADEIGVKHMTFFTFRWVPHYQHLRDLLKEGYIGRCFECHFQWTNGATLKPEEYKWRYDARRTHGAVADLGSHLVDLAHWIVGDVVAVSASVKAISRKPQHANKETDSSSDSAIIVAEFENGCHGTINVSQVAATGVNAQQVTLYGEQGILMACLSTKEIKILGRTDAEKDVKEIELPGQVWPELSKDDPPIPQFFSRLTKGPYGTGSFIDAIADDKAASPSFRDGHRAQRVIDAAIESSAKGQRVSL